MKIGKDSVVMGNVPFSTNVADRSVVTGATNANGNTIYKQTMAVGYGGKAGPDGIAIGAHANAGAATSTPPIEQQKRWWLRLTESIWCASLVASLSLLLLFISVFASDVRHYRCNSNSDNYR